MSTGTATADANVSATPHIVKSPIQILAFVKQHLPPGYEAHNLGSIVVVNRVQPGINMQVTIPPTGQSAITISDPSAARPLDQAVTYVQQYGPLVAFAQQVATFLNGP